MDPTLVNSSLIALAPGALASVIAVASFIFAQQRAQQTDRRAANKETLDLLVTQNHELRAEIADLRLRIEQLEQERKALAIELQASEAARRALHAELVRLTTLLKQSTKDIRSDVKANTTMIEHAAERADAAYEVANSLNTKIASIGDAANERLNRLEDTAPEMMPE